MHARVLGSTPEFNIRTRGFGFFAVFLCYCLLSLLYNLHFWYFLISLKSNEYCCITDHICWTEIDVLQGMAPRINSCDSLRKKQSFALCSLRYRWVRKLKGARLAICFPSALTDGIFSSFSSIILIKEAVTFMDWERSCPPKSLYDPSPSRCRIETSLFRYQRS